MKLTILGSGNWDLRPDRHPASFLVEEGDTRLLIDCGYGAIHHLAEKSIDSRSLTAIGITHFHADHLGDLMSLVDSRIMLEMRDEEDHRPLTIIGPSGSSQRWHDLHRIFCSEDLLTNAHVQIQETAGDEAFTIGNLLLRPYRVQHIPSEVCLGYQVETSGKILAFTGDVGGPISEQLSSFVDLTTAVDVLVIEAGAPVPSKSHLTFEEAITWGAKHARHKVVINHIPPHLLEKAREKLSNLADPRIVIAEDGMEVEL